MDFSNKLQLKDTMSNSSSGPKDFIYIMKAIAILSVCAAHCGSVPISYGTVNQFLSSLLEIFGTMGVWIFFFLAGFLFYPTKTNFLSLCKQKLKTLVLPWLFTGTLVYLYVTLRKGQLNIAGYLKWLLGDGSYLYFMTILLVFFAIFFFIRDIKAIIVISLLGLVSIFLTGYGMFTIWHSSPYLNPLNWILYFALGLIVQKTIKMDYLLEFSYRKIIVFLLASLICLISGAYTDQRWGWNLFTYWGRAYIIFAAISILFTIGLAKWIVQNQNRSSSFYKELCMVGKNSFSIYLLHMPIAGLIANLFNRGDWPHITLIRPFVVLIITHMFLRIYLYIGQKNKLILYIKPFIGLS